MNNKFKLIFTILSVLVIVLVTKTNVYAEDYGGGDKEYKMKIVKEVKLDGDSSYKDKVYIDLTDKNEKDKDIYFRITITNKGDKISDLEMKDFLPDELDKISGDLTKEWDSMNAGETKEFIIKANLDDNETSDDEDFEKCVVNKAELRQDGDFEGSDTATVCYGNEPTELPETGVMSLAAWAGSAMLSLGSMLKLGGRTKKKK